MNTITSGFLNIEQLAACKRLLQERSTACLEEIRGELLRSDNERYIELAGSVHDAAEESVADLLSDVGLQSVDRLVQEAQDIEAALLRIANGSYGVCTDCGEPIGYQRLSVYLTAKRCQPCQQRYENSHAGAGHASL